MMKHLRDYNSINESTTGEFILVKLKNTTEGKDLMAILTTWQTIPIITEGSEITEECLEIKASYDYHVWIKRDRKNKWKYQHKNRDRMGHKFETIESLFRHLWKDVINVYCNSRYKKFVEWVENPNCPVIGKALGLNPIFCWWKSTYDLYSPDLTEFSGPEWTDFKNNLGVSVSAYTIENKIKNASNFSDTEIIDSIKITIEPLKGSLSEAFKWFEPLTPAWGITIHTGKSNTRDSIQSEAKNKEAFEKDFLKQAFSRSYVRLQDGKKIPDLFLACLDRDNDKIVEELKKIGTSIKNSSNSMTILASIRKNNPKFYELIGPDEITTLGADLGDVGF